MQPEKGALERMAMQMQKSISRCVDSFVNLQEDRELDCYTTREELAKKQKPTQSECVEVCHKRKNSEFCSSNASSKIIYRKNTQLQHSMAITPINSKNPGQPRVSYDYQHLCFNLYKK